MPDPTWIQSVSQRMVEAAEHHAAAGEGLQGGKTKALGHAATAPIVRRVVENHLGAVKEIHQVIDPSGLNLNTQTPGLKSGNQLLQDIGTVLTLLDENIDACLLYTSPSPRDATLSRMPSSA